MPILVFLIIQISAREMIRKDRLYEATRFGKVSPETPIPIHTKRVMEFVNFTHTIQYK